MKEAYNWIVIPVAAKETDHGTSDRSESKTEKQKELMKID